ncbi:MAG: FKBP-type peptidylprolyl isomerase [Flavobacteriaceae bacterium]|nr:FKBP-type peptidylprolyl isomerase [Flavobacteriaceae bacterium]
MNNIFKILSVFVFCIVIAACSKSDDTSTTPLRDYATQYAVDKDLIDEYVNTHYMVVDPTNFDVTFHKIDAGQTSIKDQTQYPLEDTTVIQNGIDYKFHFIKFREGTEKRPTQVDSIYVSYKGIQLSGDQFDNAQNPTWLTLQSVITGWAHVFPNFHTGTYTSTPGPNPTSFNNFGAGVMFLPSGLAYYETASGSIPSYSPLIFSFKLYQLRYRDHDSDGILSKDERKLDPGISHLIRWKENPVANIYKRDNLNKIVIDVPFLDTDSDGSPDFFDIDDDGDTFLTKLEIKNPVTGLPYPFADIPSCTPNGKKKHLDKNCH